MSTNGSETEQSADAVAAWLDELTDLIINGVPGPLRLGAASAWLSDRALWEAEFGSDDVAGWLSHSVGIYLAETAQLLQAIAQLLQSRRVFATLGLLVRAVIERCGHINWLLDDAVTAKDRGARAGLEYAACFYLYRKALKDLNANRQQQTDLRKLAKDQQAKLMQWFDVYRPPDNEAVESSGPTGDSTRWTVDGHRYPILTASAEFALVPVGLTRSAAAGTYAALSGLSHPNIVFSSDHHELDDNKLITFKLERQDIFRLVAIGAAPVMDSFKRWLDYYAVENTNVIFEKIEVLAHQLEVLEQIRIDREPPVAGASAGPDVE